MSDRLSQIEYNRTSQTLELYPPESILGVPSSVTYSVWKGGADLDDSAEFSGSATVDSVSTTVDAASGFSQANRKLLNLAATTSIASDKLYLVTNAAGQKEIVKPSKITSGASIEADTDLAYDYTTSDTFQGLRCYFTVDSTFVATESNINELTRPYKVRWEYTIGGVVYRHWTYFNLVRIVVKHNVTYRDLLEEWPDLWLNEPEGDRGEKFAAQVAAAWRQVEFDIGDVADISTVRDADLNHLLIQCSLLKICETGIAPGGWEILDYHDNARRRYAGTLSKFVARFKQDQGRSGVTSSEPIRSVFSER